MIQTFIDVIREASVSLMDFHAFGLLALRIAVGAIFLVHGKSKMGAWKSAPETQPNPMNKIMKVLSVAELIGGAAMILGFMTQFAAIGLGLIMIGAIHFKISKWKMAFWEKQNTGWEFDLIILAGCISLMTLGGGAWSADTLLLNL